MFESSFFPSQTLKTESKRLDKLTRKISHFFLSLCELYKTLATMYFMLVIIKVFVQDVAKCACIHRGPFILYIHIVLHVHTVNTVFVLMSGSSVSVTQ